MSLALTPPTPQAKPESFAESFADLFKQAMRQYATGVAVVTCQHQGKAYGLTINSFTSLSLNPPLVLWCLGKNSSQAPYFESCSHFGISILAGHQEAIAKRFATPNIDRFADPSVRTDLNSAPHGSPLLLNSVAQMECQVQSRHDEGDHWLYVGRVTHCNSQEGPALLYHNKQFFAHPSESPAQANWNPSTPSNVHPSQNLTNQDFTQQTLSHQNFYSRLQSAWHNTQSMLCIGLDPDPSRITACTNQTGAALFEAIYTFCRDIVRATAPYCCAYKPQIAYFSAIGAEAVLERIIDDIRTLAPHAVVILDAKRGDIGPTAAQYAREAFVRYRADAVTVNPYMGSDSIEPYHAYPDCGVFVLCRTSNPGSAPVQWYPNTPTQTAHAQPLFQAIANWAAGPWNPHQQMGLVVGATQPAEMTLLRKQHPNLPFLVPGIGAQGGDLTQTIQAGLSPGGYGLLINASRAVLYASTGPDYAQAAAHEAQKLHLAIQAAAAQAQHEPQNQQQND